MTSFLARGTNELDSAARIRAVKIANVIGISSVMNTVIFLILFWFQKDYFLVKACSISALVYFFTISLSFLGKPNWGRPLNLLTGDLIVFWFACNFRGDSLLQLFFFSLSVMPFMYFAWEERKFYFLTFVPVFLLILGEYGDWQFFPPNLIQYDMKLVRTFSYITPLSQIMVGFFYFLKQSVHFENESNENLKKLEEEYQRHIHIHKMSSLGEMAGGISHEINNPLMVLLGATYKIKRHLKEKGEDEVVLSNVNKIENTVKRIDKIILALKKFARNVEHDPMVATPIASIINDTLDLCQERMVKQGIELKLEVEKDLSIMCRPNEISQVLVNLLNNAYDALEGNPAPWIRISASEYGTDQIEILMEDNGSGIDQSLREKIMQPFFTTKEIGKGTGLGLSISKGIIETHKGQFSLLTNTPHTTFQIILPRK